MWSRKNLSKGNYVSLVANYRNEATEFVRGGELRAVAFVRSDQGVTPNTLGDSLVAVGGSDRCISVVSVAEARQAGLPSSGCCWAACPIFRPSPSSSVAHVLEAPGQGEVVDISGSRGRAGSLAALDSSGGIYLWCVHFSFSPSRLPRSQQHWPFCACVCACLGGAVGPTGERASVEFRPGGVHPRDLASLPVARRQLPDKLQGQWRVEGATTLCLDHEGNALLVGTRRGQLLSLDVGAALSRKRKRAEGDAGGEEDEEAAMAGSSGGDAGWVALDPSAHSGSAIDCIQSFPGGRTISKSADGRVCVWGSSELKRAFRLGGSGYPSGIRNVFGATRWGYAPPLSPLAVPLGLHALIAAGM